MLIDRLENWERYFYKDERFAAAFHYLLTTLENKISDGCHQIDGDKLFASVSTYSTVNQNEKKLEAHLKYIDVQYMVKGTEAVYWRNAQELAPGTPYSAAEDIIFFDEAADCRLRLSEGIFVVFFPEDAHKPGCIWEKEETVRKIVLKIRV